MLIKTIFCEQISAATFDRRNLYGANLSDILYCPAFPYGLHATFLTLIDVDAGEVANEVKLELLLNDNLVYKYNASGPGKRVKDTYVRVEWSGLDIVIEAPGTMKMRTTVDEVERTQVWSVAQGKGARRTGGEKLPAGMLIDGRSMLHNPFFTVVNQAVGEILIFDQFVNTPFINDLMTRVAAHLKVRIVTRVTSRSGFDAEEARNLMAIFSGLEIRTSKVFHDRLVVRDLEEVYVFGASLGDLLRDRVSFFQRIFDEEQSRLTLELVRATWKEATRLD